MKKMVPVTYASKSLLNLDNYSKERYKFLSNNCVALAKLLEERVPVDAHDQGHWMDHSSHSSCGTTGCALGWAACSHIISGLQHDEILGGLAFRPKINGQTTEWHEAGPRFFGRRAWGYIFTGPGSGRSRIGTINALYREAKRLCKLAGGKEDTDE